MKLVTFQVSGPLGAQRRLGALDAARMGNGIRCRRLLRNCVAVAVVARPADDLLFLNQWNSGCRVVVFVRKSVPEIQYLKTSITEEQRRE